MKPRHTYRGVVLRNTAAGGAARGAALKPPPAQPGGGARVRVGREVAGRGGKAVTVITGLPLEAAQLDALAGRLKRLCGAGGAVKGSVIEIQGDHRDRLVAELCKLGLEAKRSGG
jgi:translation initiation factor 1